MQFQSPFHSVVKALNKEELLQTASFFHPNDDEYVEEMNIFKSPPQLKSKMGGSYKPPKPFQQDAQLKSQASKSGSVQGSPQDAAKRPGVKYVSAKKIPDNPTEVTKIAHIVILKRPINTLQVLKKQSLSQQTQMVTSQRKIVLPNSPPQHKSRMHETLQQRQKPPSPQTTTVQDDLSQSSQIFNDASIYKFSSDPTQQFIDNHEKFLQQVQLQQIHQHQMLQQKKLQHDLKLKQLQQRLSPPTAKFHVQQQNESLGFRDSNTQIEDYETGEKQISQCSQSSLQNSQLFRNSHGSFRMNGVYSKLKANLDTDVKQQGSHSKNLYNKSVQKISDISSQITLPRINSGKEMTSQVRKSQTAQENLRDQFINLQDQQNLEKQDSNLVLPQIISPQSGTLQGFGASKQGGRSFLTRRPQAKIVSRIFSSKSDKN